MERRGTEMAILGIGTALPPHRLQQSEASAKLTEVLTNAGYKQEARWAKKIFNSCGVETRYTCDPALALVKTGDNCRYLAYSSPHQAPSTEERMRRYREEAVPLSYEAAVRALADSGVNTADITHLMTVSCTGLFLPGLDAALVHKLELAADVQRIPLSFLGCAAGMTALRMSADIVDRSPGAKVLVVCVELCTLHIQPSGEREALFGAAFFGDGASACVVGCPAADDAKSVFKLGRNRSVLFPDSAGEMVWNIGNYGFELYLSAHIPKLIGQYVPPEIDRLLDGEPAPEFWAIHPGGRGIIDTLQSLYELGEEELTASRSVLRRYGNLSSATILFVLEHLRQAMALSTTRPRKGIAMAFGPGLNAELMQLTYCPPSLS